MASESWSAFTLQATRSWAVDAATCLADEMSFSSLAWPCTEALAASHKLLVAAATIRACVAQKVRKTSVPPWALHDERFEVLHHTLFCLNCEEKHHCRRFVSFHQELKISLQYLSYCWHHYRLGLCGCAKYLLALHLVFTKGIGYEQVWLRVFPICIFLETGFLNYFFV